MEKLPEIKTTDLFLSAYLYAKGFKSSKPPQLERHLVSFFFPKTKELEEACREFINRVALIDPLSVLESYRVVKSTAWDIKKGVTR